MIKLVQSLLSAAQLAFIDHILTRLSRDRFDHIVSLKAHTTICPHPWKPQEGVRFLYYHCAYAGDPHCNISINQTIRAGNGTREFQGHKLLHLNLSYCFLNHEHSI